MYTTGYSLVVAALSVEKFVAVRLLRERTCGIEFFGGWIIMGTVELVICD